MDFDLTIIGSGPGGYTAAIRASQLGFKTALVERYPNLGGTCLNVGCIPSKTLLNSSEHYYYANHKLKKHGIKIDGISLDWEAMLARKREVVGTVGKGIDYLMKKNNITVLNGRASFKDPQTILITSADNQTQTLQSKYFIIATGSEPVDFPGVIFDKERIISSTQALELKEIPETMLIIGAGVIGLELGSVYSRLGTQVTVIEFLDRCIAGMDNDLGKQLKLSLKKMGMRFHFGHKVLSAVNDKKAVTVSTIEKDKEHTFTAEYCLVAVGRRPLTKGLEPANAGVNLTQNGFIQTDNHLKTSADHIFAIGDVAGMPMLAHKSEEEGVFVVENLAGQKPHINYSLIPGIVYTTPEVAAVGLTEEQVKETGKAYKIGKFPFSALGRARAADETAGFVKIIADESSDEILGVHIIGDRASDLIAEAVIAMEFKASAEDITRICHGHPTYSEAIRHAALVAGNRPLNL